MQKWGTGGEAGELNFPHGLSLGPDGFVYIADTFNHRVQKFSKTGGFEKEWGNKGEGVKEFDHPQGMAVETDGFVYIADTYNHRVQKFTPDGEYQTQWGTEGNADDQFFNPYGIAADNTGHVYIADTDHHRIQKWTSAGTHETNWGTEGGGTGQFQNPHGIAVSGGYVYVADTFNHRIQKWTLNGVHEADWGSEGSADEQFNYPYGIAVDDAGFVYVADTWNHRIQIFTATGGYVGKFGSEGSDPGQLKFPGAVAVEPDGSLVYVSDSDNHRVQVFRRISSASGNRAVIIAGGGPYPGNDLWPATQAAANFAYRTLTYQGFDGDSICYLSSDTDLDLNDDGQPDVDFAATKANLESVVRNWVNNPASPAQNLMVYLVDHGKKDAFRLNETDSLTAQELRSWLDSLVVAGTTIALYDACNAGSFMDDLSAGTPGNRVVITSASEGERAWFVNQGTLSFSNLFWTHVFNGGSVGESFRAASESIRKIAERQTPLLNADEDGNPNEDEDFVLADAIHLLNRTAIDEQAGLIDVCPSRQISGTASAEIWATVTDGDGVARVWATIIPPRFGQTDEVKDKTVMEMPAIDLPPVGDNLYKAEYGGFNDEGIYKIIVHAEDRNGNLTPPKMTEFTVGNPIRRKAVIVSGGAETDGRRSAMEASAQLAHNALMLQGYRDDTEVDDIYYISPEISYLGWNGGNDPGVLRFALTDWAMDAQDVVVCLIGGGKDGEFQINGSATVTATELDGWLDALQTRIPGMVTLVCDADYSGSFLPALIPPPGKERIVISGAAADQNAYFHPNGTISFSGFFWKNIGDGMNVRQAFATASGSVVHFTGTRDRVPMLDDNGNGIGNERSDGIVASAHTIGAGIRTTADGPFVRSAPADVTISGGQTVTLRAENITTTDAIENIYVWAMITPPGLDSDLASGRIADLPTIPLLPLGGGRYENNYSGFPDFGTYRVSVFASDSGKNVSLANETAIFQSVGPDVYEPDNSHSAPSLIVVDHETPQQRNFHDSDTEDWVAFYAIKGEIYRVQALGLGEKCDILIEIFDSNFIGIGDARRQEDTLGKAYALWEGNLNDGVHYLKITNLDTQAEGKNTGYDLKVFLPDQPFSGFLKGIVTDTMTQLPVVFASVRTDANAAGLSRFNGRYMIIQEPGTFTADVSAFGYEPISGRPVVISEGGTTVMNFELTPEDRMPIASIITPVSDLTVDVGERLYFLGQASDGNPPLGVMWNFGGVAENSYTENPGEILFDAPGSHKVTFTVTDADGDISTDWVIITALGGEPDPELSISSPQSDVTILSGESVYFQGSAMTGGKEPITYAWNFGNGTYSSLKDPGPVMFLMPGVYPITFTATDVYGNTVTAVMTVTVTETPVATIDSPKGPVFINSGESVTFLGMFVGSAPVGYMWDFGGGAENAEVKDPGKVVFQTSGVYTVTFRVTDQVGHVYEATVTVAVGIAAPSFAPSSADNRYVFQTGSAADENGPVTTRWRIVSADNPPETAIDLRTAGPDSVFISDFILDPDTAYSCQIRHVFENDEETEWSDALPFRTAAIANDRETDADLDGDGMLDTGLENAKCIQTGIRKSKACVNSLQNSAVLTSVRYIAKEDFPDKMDTPKDLPYGIAFKLDVSPGDTVRVSVLYTESQSDRLKWYAYSLSENGWTEGVGFSEFDGERKTVSLTLTDGGTGDADGTENGIIVHLSGLGTALPIPKTDPPDSNDVGGTDCFVRSAGAMDLPINDLDP